jgi:hypothetical protein
VFSPPTTKFLRFGDRQPHEEAVPLSNADIALRLRRTPLGRMGTRARIERALALAFNGLGWLAAVRDEMGETDTDLAAHADLGS